MIGCALLISSLLAGQIDAAAGQDPKADARRLVVQLDSPRLAVRDAAEQELLRTGPEMLDLLPAENSRMSAEVRQRLSRVRQRLEQRAAEAAGEASTVSLRGENMPLAVVLAALAEQSGNPIIEARKPAPTAKELLKVDFDKAPFWQSLDQVLDRAGVAMQPGPTGIEVIDRGGRQPKHSGPPCYSGPFRIEATDVSIAGQPGQATPAMLRLKLAMLWEPRLKPIYFTVKMADIEALDRQGAPWAIANREAQLELPIDGRGMAKELPLLITLPASDSGETFSLRGRFTAVIAGRTAAFRFGDLADGNNLVKRIAGAAVTLEDVRPGEKSAAEGKPAEKAWEIRVRLRFDDAGDALASHRQWIFGNPAFLELPGGDRLRCDHYETTAQSKNELGVAFHFKTAVPLGELTFVYKTPVAIVTKEVGFDLPSVRLPREMKPK